MSLRSLFLILLMMATAAIVAACGSDNSAKVNTIVLAPESQLHPDLQSAPTEVKEAYRFALANKELLEQIPCFCGCSAAGHTSNYRCYVVEDGEPGSVIQFENHALG
ncbi:MAG: hypothetical protein GXP37_11130 [Chloroflexi bacterium]|nr:hypothetical protein [Chloroflexota bacterium]